MPYCSSCGLLIPEGQGKSCSMCYGDPDYGRDGYYKDYLERQRLDEEMERQQEEEKFESGIPNLLKDLPFNIKFY